MKRKVETWTIEKLCKKRGSIDFPEFQRNPRLWSKEMKRHLIDSILCEIDIPKLYLSKEGDKYFVIDGQQRLWAIWDFVFEDKENCFPITLNGKEKLFSELENSDKDRIKEYPIQIVVLTDMDDEYLRKMFLRLQLGLLLRPGEKLNALSGEMKDFIFGDMIKNNFIKTLPFGDTRHNKANLCAQICINSYYRNKEKKEFHSTRFEHLQEFIRDNLNPDQEEFDSFKERVICTLNILDQKFADKTPLRNKSLVLSIYLFVEEFIKENTASDEKMKDFVDFVNALTKRLKEEADVGFARTNKELYVFQSYISSASGEKYQIERRHKKLAEFFEHFQATNGKIKGDNP